MSGCAGTPTIAPNGQAVPHNTTTIKAFSTNSSSTQFKKLKQLAVNSGFSITSQDLDTRSFSTDYKGHRHLGVKLTISVVQQGNRSIARISGKYKLIELDGSPVNPIKHLGQAGSPARNAWNLMYQFAIASRSNSYSFE